MSAEKQSGFEVLKNGTFRYEQEIRRRTDELEKKMRDLDTLNRRCDGLSFPVMFILKFCLKV